MRKTSLALALAGIVASGGAQAGELFFDFNRNTVGNTANASVFLFGSVGQTATVTTLSGFNQTVTLGSEGFFNLAIANSFQQSGTGVRTTGFRVVSDDPIAGYFVNRAGFSTDMTYLLDSSSLGTDYVVASQGGDIGEGSQVAIHATQDNTTVTFTPTVGAPVTVTLNAGQTYKYAGGSANLTGSSVAADKPVAVFSGHECAQVPVGTTACDNLVEQMIPTDRLSTSYVLTASKAAVVASSASDLVRVIATADGTQVNVDGVTVATLNKGQFHEYSLAANNGSVVEASSSVMVAQYLKGQGNAVGPTDPALSLVPGADTWLAEYRLATPSGAQDFTTDYASIVIESDALTTLLLDGSPAATTGCSAIGATVYSRCDITLPNGLFDLTAADPFLVMLGGGGNFDSYFTYGGATFATGISPPPPPPPVTTPEPASLALFGVGLLGLARLRRRH